MPESLHLKAACILYVGLLRVCLLFCCVCHFTPYPSLSFIATTMAFAHFHFSRSHKLMEILLYLSLSETSRVLMAAIFLKQTQHGSYHFSWMTSPLLHVMYKALPIGLQFKVK